MKRGRTWRNRKRNIRDKVDEYTGRGLKATRTINPGDVIVSLPETLLITPVTALESAVGDVIKRCRPRLTPQAALSLFLVYENHLGSRSDWFAYIQSVPAVFSTPLYWTPQELGHLPPAVRESAGHMIDRHRDVYDEIVAVLKSLPHCHTGWFSYDSFQWAWTVVNTRSVYLETKQVPLLQFTPSGETNLALAPFLDLLNHSDSAQMEAGHNAKTRCYEIKTFNKFKKHDQVFISYGYHDNQKLFLEYGFTIPGNTHNVHQFSWTELCNLKRVFKISHWQKKQSVIFDNRLNQDLTCSTSGLSWNLHNVLMILAMSWDELESWKRWYSNGTISDENERCVRQMAAWLMNEAIVDYKHMKVPCSETNPHDRLVSSLLQGQLDILHKTWTTLQV
ncbi:SET domain-containing protein 4-like isoform X2 [Gigantopelta aegis]|uniref:SET domain-containing protein 4-like isoform X2 n=1 Tax=Gigantopelta aegis TaxID=1735272 RepID=UPI001B88D8FE|nr:SET domain-containing protein 4-like isoform X2 [Gigantopelta aegis]